VWHHWYDPTGLLTFSYDGHATNVMNAFQNGTGSPTSLFGYYAQRKITVKVYDMMDLKPREVRGTAVHTPTTWSSSPLGPREIAVPLRYYAHRNLVGQRGRMFIGPWVLSLLLETVDTPTIGVRLLDLAQALAAIGGANTSWCMHSDKQDVLNAPGSPGGTSVAAWHDITYAWVNDQWAHMTTREHVELARVHAEITPGIP
jgi:hypothetical protein